MGSSEYDGNYSDTDSSGLDYSFICDTSSDNSEVETNAPSDSLIDKNGTFWTIEKPSTSRTAAENILTSRAGVSSFVLQNVNEIIDTFKVFFRQEMYDLILKHTNQYGKHFFGDAWKQLDSVEFDGFIGCLLLMGIFDDNQQPVKELFGLEEGRQVYRDLFSLNRFQQIKRALHFDDFETRETRKTLDKFCHIRELWDIWVDSLIQSFRPFEDLCVDEQLVAFRGRCKFKQYMPKKPSKYGLKFYLITGPKSTFVCNAIVYLGKRSQNDTRAVNVGRNIVLKLVEPFERSGRNVVCDNFFTSIELADELLQKKLSIVGTMRSNKREIPPYLRPHKTTPLHSSLFVFNNKKMMLRYLPRRNKPVYILCSSSTNIQISTERPLKPNVIMHYNAVKGGVDTISRLLAAINVRRISCHWSLIVFFNMVDISLINAFCIYKNLFPSSKLLRREFLKMMATQLTHRLLLRRKQNMTTSEDSPVIIGQNSYGRCRFCDRKYDRKTKIKCDVCASSCCKFHSSHICLILISVILLFVRLIK